MKIPVLFYIVLATILLVLLVIMLVMDMPFNWVFFMTCVGEVLVIFMVYKVLRDKYATKKTFDDFYEDHPIGKEERQLRK
ncbi:MAG TPA: hypothetical protein VNJ50_07175 [Gelidibacter sp.]|uniref:hypothetical protein n=1 Tax=Gelidibacter sp. TaxID=2018083 RepID=UPI002B84FC97|nr:hypothetical protein [Gelidibacter sp.]HXJ98613.1 hypothetical protein [Gelidibacter sp.]